MNVSDPRYMVNVIRDTPAGVEFDVRVIPRARKTEYAGVRDQVIVVRVAAPPVDDAANHALVDFLADTLDVPRRSVRIVSGERNRRKRLAVAGVTADRVRGILGR